MVVHVQITTIIPYPIIVVHVQMVIVDTHAQFVNLTFHSFKKSNKLETKQKIP